MGRKLLYEVIFHKYRDLILAGDLAPESKLPTEMEMAGEFGVSRITVSRALRELEAIGLIRRIKGSGSYVNNTRRWRHADGPDGASPLSLSLISLVLPFHSAFSSDILRGIEDVAAAHGHFVSFHNTSSSADLERRIIEQVIEKGSRGVIVYPTEPYRNMDIYSRLLIRKHPFVVLDRTVPGIDVPLVSTDNCRGFYDVTRHLLELGHRRIAISGSTIHGVSSERDRYEGFCRAHLDYGVPLLRRHAFAEENARDMPCDYRPDDPLLTRECHVLFDELESIEAEQRPTAIAAINDDVARVIIETAMSRGLTIPGDYSVTGFDDLPFARHLAVPLTTVAQPAYELGRVAAEMLAAAIDHESPVSEVRMVRSTLVVRSSTAPPVTTR